MRARALLPVLALAAGCSLPLPSGVHTSSGVTGEDKAAELQVLPQGPTAGISQQGAVSGFLAAQASPAGDYAIAREFLTGDAARSWSPHSGIRVFRPEKEQVTTRRFADGSVSVLVHLVAVGDVDTRGRFVPGPRSVNDAYGVTKVREGWRISSLPPGVGLQLSETDLKRTFAVRNVYYLAPRLPGQGPARHLVPDRAFLTGGPGLDATAALVRRALGPPSAALAGSVDPVLEGVSAVSVTRSRDGVVTVTLSEDANGLGADDLRDLSARLVWTLRSDRLFSGLRLRTARGVLRPQGASDVQAASSWQSYDPEGLGDNPAYFFASGDRLRASGLTLPASRFTQPGSSGVAVDAVAVSPRGGRIATLHPAGGLVEVDLGSTTDGRVFSSAGRHRGLSSPTWGSGEGGLWMLQGTDQVVRLDGTTLRVVPITGRPKGPLTSLALSRDGARAALVVDRRLYVAKVVWRDGAPTLVSPSLLPTFGRPSQVVWASPTELVVLQPDQGALAVLRIAMDGTALPAVLTGGLRPSAIAAAGPVLLVESDGALYSVAQGIIRVQKDATAAAFPG